MGRLSVIFNSDDNTNDSSNMTHGDLGNALGVNLSSSSDSWERDEDGNESRDSSDNSLSIDNDTDGLLHNMSDTFSSSDDSEVG
jgi:hypothetical protein